MIPYLDDYSERATESQGIYFLLQYDDEKILSARQKLFLYRGL